MYTRKPNTNGERAYYYMAKGNYAKAIVYAQYALGWEHDATENEQVLPWQCEYVELLCICYHKLDYLVAVERNAKILLNSSLKQERFQNVLGRSNSRYIASAYFYLGTVSLSKNDCDQAIMYYTKATSLDRAYQESLDIAQAHSYFKRGNKYLEKSKFHQAILAFSKALKFIELAGPYYSSGIPPIYYTRANAYQANGQLTGALIDANEAARLDPSSRNLHLCGKIKIKLREFFPAYLDLCAAIRLCQDQNKLPLIYHDRAVALYEMGLFDEAITQEKEVIELNSNLVEPIDIDSCYFIIGKCYFQQYKIKEAAAAFLNATKLDENNADYHFMLARSYLLLGELENAISSFSKAIEIDPCRSEYYAKRGRSYYKLKKYEDALIDFKKALEIDPLNEAYDYLQRETDKKLKLSMHTLSAHKITLFGKEVRIYTPEGSSLLQVPRL